MRLTPLQKDRLRSPDILIDLSGRVCATPGVDAVLERLEELVGLGAANRIASILACTEYGLSETEILELIMPTGGEEPLLLEENQFNFATWCLVRRTFAPWLKVSRLGSIRIVALTFLYYISVLLNIYFINIRVG